MDDQFTPSVTDDITFDVDVVDAPLPDNVVTFPGLSTDPRTDEDAPAVEPIVDYTVHYAGRDFTIEEPDMETTIRLMNMIGTMGTRMEQFMGANMSGMLKAVGSKGGNSAPLEAMLLSLLASLQTADVLRLSAIVLFGGGKRREDEGLAWLNSLPQNKLRFAPVVKATMYRIQLSDDLAESLGNLQLIQGVTRRLSR